MPEKREVRLSCDYTTTNYGRTFHLHVSPQVRVNVIELALCAEHRLLFCVAAAAGVAAAEGRHGIDSAHEGSRRVSC